MGGKRRSLEDSMGAAFNEVENSSSFTGTKQLSQMIPLQEIKLDPEFQALFPLDDDMVADVARSMEESEFDPTQPLVCWRQPDNSIILLDGHTRYAAAKMIGLYDVPVFIKEFENRDAAMYYALGLQLFRRNLSQQQMVGAAKKLFELGEKTGKVRIKDIKASLTKRLDISDKTAGRIVAVARNEEAAEAVLSGEKSVNQAYNELEKREYTRSAREEVSSVAASSVQDIPDDMETADAEMPVSEESEPEADDSDDSDGEEAESSDSFVDGVFSISDDGDDGEDDSEGEECGGEEESSVHADVDSVAGNRAPAVSQQPVKKPAVRQERHEEPLPDSAGDDSEFFEDDSADASYVEGFMKAFWYILAEIDRKTTVEEILSWFAGRKAFTADALRAFEIPDYDAKEIDRLKEIMKQMQGRHS